MNNYCKINIIFCLLLSLFVQISVYAGDGGEGSGGDAYHCDKFKGEYSKNGYYSFDFIQKNIFLSGNIDNLRNTGEKLPDSYKLKLWNDIGRKKLNIKSCDDYLKRILNKLYQINPVMGAGFESFIKSVNGKRGKKYDFRTWVSKEQASKVNKNWKVDDEVRGENFKDPIGCETEQFVIRYKSKKDKSIIYEVNDDVLNKLKENPLQCSYALVHEWVRDFSNDVPEIYQLVDNYHTGAFLACDVNSFLLKVVNIASKTVVNPYEFLNEYLGQMSGCKNIVCPDCKNINTSTLGQPVQKIDYNRQKNCGNSESTKISKNQKEDYLSKYKNLYLSK